ncbi:ATP-binding cassette domain-containing protein [unidentified bacterial endosymbiont]|uniref:ATP-binding cassette domain-containing protein n=1 Tax=unidentified bacterial endosymbiont TaxID=2355 RepID=UPI00209E184B|nr:ABC transporter ATP-binding protein [unidentified bacterial endosymbiont]
MTLLQDFNFFLRKICNINHALKVTIIFNVLCALLFVAVTLSVPYALKMTVDTLSQADRFENAHEILCIVSLYCVIWTANQVLQWVRTLLCAPLIAKCDSASQILLYLHLIKIRYEIIKTMDIGLLYATLTRCRTAFSTLSFSFFWIVIPVLFQITIGSLFIFVVLGALPGIIILVSAFILLFSSLHFSSKTTQAHLQSFEAQNLLSVHFNEKILSIVEIKTNNAYHREDKTIQNVANQYNEKLIQSSKGFSLIMINQSVVSGIVFTVIHLFAAWFVYRQTMNIGDFILMSGYIVSLIAPFDALAASFSDLKKNHLALLEGINILNTEQEGAKTITQKKKLPVLEITGYRSPYSSDSLNVTINCGDILLITGESGKGKTTLLHSIIGLTINFSGSIRLYGCDVRKLSPSSISSVVSFVQQEPTIFSGTVRDNLLYGFDGSVDDARLHSVLNGLCLSGLNNTHPLDYHVGQKGNKLSGGEKRRLAIARAVIRDLPVMVLDEPTSGLDYATEQSVMSYLSSLGKTILLVSHSRYIHKYCTNVIDMDSIRARDKTTE